MSNIDEEGNLYGVRGSSGGYADTLFRYASKMLFGKEIDGPLEYMTVRNADLRELTLEVSLIFLHSADSPEILNLYFLSYLVYLDTSYSLFNDASYVPLVSVFIISPSSVAYMQEFVFVS